MECSRRRFVWGAGLAAGAACPALSAIEAFAQDSHLSTTIEVAEHQYKRLSDRRTQCFVCPLECVLEEGQTCFCRTRTNEDGRLISHAYNNPCILTLDPIEKLPLSHFLPGEQAMCLALGGCNLRCLYCQNWQQSQSKPDTLKNSTMLIQSLVTFSKVDPSALDALSDKGKALINYIYEKATPKTPAVTTPTPATTKATPEPEQKGIKATEPKSVKEKEAPVNAQMQQMLTDLTTSMNAMKGDLSTIASAVTGKLKVKGVGGE